MRTAYRVLMNVGCIPPELEMRKEIINIKSLINTIEDDKKRARKSKELNISSTWNLI